MFKPEAPASGLHEGSA